MMIDRAVVEKVAQLSRLALDEKEIELYIKQLNDILSTMEILKSIDTEGIAPLAHVLPLKNVMRADEVQPSMAKKEILANAPDEIEGMFGVPKIV